MQWNVLKSHLRHLSSADQKRIQHSFEVGKKAHGEQKRMSGEPYFMHPIAVAHILADMGADADTLIAALLHDTIEDTELTLQEIDLEFNGDVSALIDGVTKLEPEDVAEYPSLDDQIETLRKMFNLIEDDVRVIVIKLVDRLHNMQTIEHLSKEKQRTMAKETMDVYVKIADRLSMQDIRDELEGLCLSVLEKEKHAKLTSLQDKNEQKSERAIDMMHDELLDQYPKLMRKTDIFYERKSWGKLLTQFNSGQKKATGITDMVVVFLCTDISECYQILGALHQTHPRETLSFQDFINAPMINGYRGMHTTLILEKGTRVRCKIRTEDMHDYARNGIATLCFDDKAMGVMDYLLPWTEHIAPLSEDTETRSTDFWESLQNDILGESIIIHGANDQRIIVPKDSTALDGACYCYGKKILNLTSIQIDGIDVPFHMPLNNATSLSINIGKKKTVERNWLQYTNSGLATAMIRNALSLQSSGKQRKVGKELLQDLLSEHKKGYIEEFDEKSISAVLKILGYKSLNDTYEAIANGHLDPSDVYEALFDTKRKRTNGLGNKIMSKICFTMNFDDFDSVTGTLGVYKDYGISLKSVQFRPFSMMHGKICVRHAMTPREQKSITADLQAVGIEDVTIIPASRHGALLTMTVILLWALNPVFAKWLLLEGMEPITLVTIRQLVFCVFTGVFYGIWRLHKKEMLRVPRITQLAFLPALGMFALAIFTYNALLNVPASVHLTILRLNVFLIPVIYLARKKKCLPTGFITLAILGAIGLSFQLFMSHNMLLIGTIFSVLALVSYLFFSLTTEEVLQQHKIDMRYPYFLFQIGIILGILGVAMIPFLPVSALFSPLTIPAIIYSLVCVCIPYTCYSAVLKKIRFKHITNLFLLEVPIAAFLEIMLLRKQLPYAGYFVLGGVLLILAILGKIIEQKKLRA